MQKQPKFVRRENLSEKLQENANQYDAFIRKAFRVFFQLEKDTSEKVELLKDYYFEICSQEVERNELFISRLKKVKVEIDMEKSSMGQHFLQVIKLLKTANIIDPSTFNELASEGLADKEPDLANYVQRRKELATDKRFINLLLQQKMGQQARSAKALKVHEILEQFGKIDYSALDPNKELKVEFEHYGSSQNGLGLLSSDFDISLTTLKQVDGRKLLDYFAKEAKPILNSIVGKENYYLDKLTSERMRIPVVNLYLKKGDISISFTVNNILGVYNSKLLKAYAQFDTRCHSLCLLVKIWARVHKVLSVQRGFLSSYALNLMVINFLQCMENPILPSLQKESKKDEIIEVYRKVNYDNLELFNANVKFETDPQIIQTLQKQYSENKLTDIELLKEFFAFYSHRENFNTIKLSIKEGNHEKRSHKEEGFLYSIQDPFDIHHNPGSSLKKDSTQAQEFLDRMQKSHKLLEQGRFKEVFQFFML